jgi:hypothetical protein
MNARVEKASDPTKSHSIERFFIERTMDDLKRENPKKFEGIEKLDPELRDLMLQIARLQLIHHPTRHFKEARLFLHLAVISMLGSEGQLIAIYGESHSGKSHILSQLRQHKALQPDDTSEGKRRPLLMLKARSPCTLKQLGIDILTALKSRDSERGNDLPSVNPKSYATASQAWAEVGPLLQAYGVRVLVIDEIHSILTGDGKKHFADTAAAIKSLLIDSRWPISVVIAGTTVKTKKLLEKSMELGQRLRRVEIEPIPKDRLDLIEDLVSAIENKLELPKPSNLAGYDSPELRDSPDLRDLPLRFLMATSGHRGRIAKLIFDAARLAYLGEYPSITKELLARALKHRTGVADEVNAFLMENAAMAPIIADEAWEKDDEEDVSPLTGKNDDSGN